VFGDVAGMSLLLFLVESCIYVLLFGTDAFLCLLFCWMLLMIYFIRKRPLILRHRLQF
jgi:hypothetical protein